MGRRIVPQLSCQARRGGGRLPQTDRLLLKKRSLLTELTRSGLVNGLSRVDGESTRKINGLGKSLGMQGRLPEGFVRAGTGAAVRDNDSRWRSNANSRGQQKAP
jgi:hypothetical protein